MSALSKYWKALLAAIMAAAAAFLYTNVYKTEKLAYESETQSLRIMIQAAQAAIAENRPYADVQDQLDAAKEELTASRLDLYNHLPVDVKQEDQIMYVLYLESVFGSEISFEFSEPMPVSTEELPTGQLYDGSILKSVDLIVNYRSTYDGFQEMINYLAQDYRVVSVDKANIKYYPKQDLAIGYVKIKLYLLDTSESFDEEIRKYVAPIDKLVNIPNTGKDNIFANEYDQPTKEIPNKKQDPSREDLQPSGGSDLDSKVWVTQHDNKYHSRYACGYMYGPVEAVFADVLAAGVQPCEKCFAVTGATELESNADVKEKVYNKDTSSAVASVIKDSGVTGIGQSGTTMVWVTKTGDCYHRISDCGNTQDSWQESLEDAKAKGLYKCSNCY